MKNPIIFPAEVLKQDGLEEEIDKRKINSKTYSLTENKHRAEIIVGAVHYKDNPTDDNEQWKEIDLTIRDEGEFFVVDKTHYNLKIFKDEIGYTYTSRLGGRVDVKLNSINDIPIQDLNPNISQEILVDNNRLVWRDPVEGIDMFIAVRPLKVSLYKSIKTATAPRKFSWDVYEDTINNASFNRKTSGNDKVESKMEIINVIEDKGIIKSTETSNDYRHLVFTEEFTGRVAKVKDRRTRQKEWSTEIQYPAVIDADVNEQIGFDVDDGQERVPVTTWFSNIAAWECGYYSGYGAYHGGVRFRTIPIPRSEVIIAAKLILKITYVVGTPNNRLYGDKVGDAALWANGNLPSGITKTTAWKALNVTAVATYSAAITNVVQEIIDLGAWTSNNDMRFGLLDYAGAGSNAFSARDYNNDPATAAKLEIDYGDGAPAVPLQPTLKILTKGGAMVGGGAKLPLHPWRHTRG